MIGSHYINLAILIPIHEESKEIVMAAVNHYRKSGLIYLIDSSEKNLGIINQDNVKYIHLPNVRFLNKIHDSLKQIKSDFILLTPVDDYCCMNEILFAYEKVISRNDFAFLGGDSENILNFSKSCKDFQQIYEYEDVIKLKQSKLFLNYSLPLLWGLYSSKSLHQLIMITTNYNYDNDNFIELSNLAILPKIGEIYKTNKTFFYRTNRLNSWGRKHNTLNLLSLLLFSQDQRTYLRMLSNNALLLKLLPLYVFYLTQNSILCLPRNSILYRISRKFYRIFKSFL